MTQLGNNLIWRKVLEQTPQCKEKSPTNNINNNQNLRMYYACNR
jgi:hypothetical protein